MTSAEFSQRFLDADPGSLEAARLARDLVEDARYPGHFASQRGLPSSNKAEQAKAMHVLAELRELAFAPLCEATAWPDIDTELWAMRTMAEEFMDFRQRAALVLKDLLINRLRTRRVPEGSSPSQPPPGTRTCDLAFILLHRLFHLESFQSRFLAASPEERDRRIRDFQTSLAYRSAFEGQL